MRTNQKKSSHIVVAYTLNIFKLELLIRAGLYGHAWRGDRKNLEGAANVYTYGV